MGRYRAAQPVFIEGLESRRFFDAQPFDLDIALTAGTTGANEPVTISAEATGTATDGFSSFEMKGSFSLAINNGSISCDAANAYVEFNVENAPSFFGSAGVGLNFAYDQNAAAGEQFS